MKDYYAILGLDNSATASDIVRAHHQLSLQFHPDNFNGDILFKNMYEDIQEAYQVLRDVNGRKVYDEMFIIKKELDNIELGVKELKSQYDFEEPEENEIEENDSYLISDTDHANQTQSDFTEEIHFEDFETEDSNGDPLVEDILDNSDRVNHPKEKFWSAKGRIGRTTYFLRSLLLVIILYVIVFASGNNNEIFQGFFLIGIAIISSFQAIKRLHDINKSGWWILAWIIPYINIVFGLFILFIPGTKGPNKYGVDPKKR